VAAYRVLRSEDSRRLRLTDFKTKVVSTTHRPPVSPRKYSWYSFLLKVDSVAGRTVFMKNSNDTIGNRNRDLPACSAVPQPTTLSRVPDKEMCTK